MQRCPDCSKQLNRNENYCSECGAEANLRNLSENHESEAYSMSLNDKIRTEGGESLILVGGLITIFGAFLPWVTILGQSRLGVSGDGLITLLFGVAVVGVAAFGSWTRVAKLSSLALGLLIAFIALFDFTNYAGTGIYLTLLGGLIIIISSAKPLLD